MIFILTLYRKDGNNMETSSDPTQTRNFHLKKAGIYTVLTIGVIYSVFGLICFIYMLSMVIGLGRLSLTLVVATFAFLALGVVTFVSTSSDLVKLVFLVPKGQIVEKYKRNGMYYLVVYGRAADGKLREYTHAVSPDTYEKMRIGNDLLVEK